MCSEPGTSPAIRVQDVVKDYRIWASPSARVHAPLLTSLAPLLGRRALAASRKLYRDFRALHGVSFEVREGETVGIIGRNGSGKSTLLQIVAGILQPTAGAVEVNGKVAALLELGSGFNPEFTGRENVYLNGAVLGLSREQINQRFEDILHFANIGDFLDQPVKTYSSGMVMRLAFAVAVHVDASVLIIDEALSVGDERFQAKCFRKIEEIKARGTSILFVAHSIPTVNQICDRAILLDHGRQIIIGSAKEATDVYSRVLGGIEATQALALHQRESTGDQVSAPSPEEIPAGDVPAPPAVPLEGRAGIITQVRLAGSTSDDAILAPGQVVKFILDVAFFADTRQVICGMMIRTPTGVDCYHTNTFCRQGPIAHCPAGSRLRAEFTMPLLLGPGRYLATFDCQSFETGTSQLVDIRNEAIAFLIAPTRMIEDGGIAALGAQIHHTLIPPC